MSSGRTWASDVLRRLGIHPNPSAVFALRKWSQSEGNLTGERARYNWLNSVGPATGSTAYNTVGVQNYTSYTQGVNQTAALLRGPGWTGVTRALASRPTGGAKQKLKTGTVLTRAVTAKIFTAIHNSPAAGSPAATRALQTGHYPVALWTFQMNKGATAGGTWPTSTITKGTPNPTAKQSDPCRVGFTGPLGLGKLCLITTSQLQALKGGLLVAAGGVVMFVGLAILAAYGLGRGGPLGQVTRTARSLGIGRSSSRSRRSGSSQPRTREADRQVAAATPEQLAGTPTPTGKALRDQHQRTNRAAGAPTHTGPFDERDVTPALARRSGERRPRSARPDKYLFAVNATGSREYRPRRPRARRAA